MRYMEPQSKTAAKIDITWTASVDIGSRFKAIARHVELTVSHRFTLQDDETIDVRGEQKLIGLTKEQLARYRDDPVWKPIRSVH